MREFVPTFRRLLISAFFALLLCPNLRAQEGSAGPAGNHDRRELRVAAVQLRISEDWLRSFADYRAQVEALVLRCLPFRPDLIVFPEYASVFLTLIPYYGVIHESYSAQDGLARIREKDPLVRSFKDLFLLNSGLTEQAMQDIFASLARRYRVAILAGTFFAWDGRAGEARLVNRAVLYDSSGRAAYSQDKVFLTPFEEQLLGVTAGEIRDAYPFEISGFRVGVSICRDTFFEQWQDVLSGADLWIDIKANGQRFNPEEQQRFLRALPARIAAGDVPYGLTVCLTGTLLDLLWEGESSLVGKGPEGEVRFIRRATSAAEQGVLLLTIPTQPR